MYRNFPKQSFRRISHPIFWAFGFASLLVSTPVRGEFVTPIAITDVTVVTGTGSRLDHATIIINEGRIVSVGPNVEVPPEAEQIDGTGLIAYPGLLDAHSNFGIAEKTRTVDQRKRTEDRHPDLREGPFAATRFANRRGIQPQTHARNLYEPDEEKLAARRTLGFTTALIAPRDAILAGTSDLINLSDEPLRRAVVAADVAMHASFHVHEDGTYPRTLLGVFAQFRQVMLDAQRQNKVEKYYQRHPQETLRAPTDPVLDALQPLLARSRRIIFEANTENEIRRALSLTHELNLDAAISGAKEAWKVIDLLKAERVPLIVSLKFDEEPEYGREKPSPLAQNAASPSASQKERQAAGDRSAKSTKEPETDKGSDSNEEGRAVHYEPLKLRKERRRLWEEQVHNVVRLHEAGIPFALRTRDLKKAATFFKNLRMVIERGLPEDAALVALTVTPARFFGLAGQIGTIEPGKIANLILSPASLASDKFKPKFVFIDGKKYERDEFGEKKEDGKGKKETGDKTPAKSAGGSVASASAQTPREKAATQGLPSPDWAVETKADRKPKTHTGGSVLIRNATVIPVTSPTLQNASILILDGKIKAIGTDLAAPPGVTVIDATGRFAVPGFVDCHSHLGIDAINESPLAISAEVRIADVINPQSIGIYRAIAGGTTTHHAMHGSANPIGGQNAITKLKYGRPASEMLIADAPRTIKFALGENVIQSNFSRAWGKRYPNTRMGVEATIRIAFEAAKAYQKKWDTYHEKTKAHIDTLVPRRDLRLEALADILSGNLTIHAHCYRADEILRLLTVAEEYSVRIGTLQHVLEGYRIRPEIARHGAGASTFANDWAYKVEAYGAIPHNAAMMTEAGITTSVNSDSPLTIRYLNQEAAKCIRWGGLDENQALRLITINPAMQLQIEDRVGSLEVGKDGDIAIFNGHPLNGFSKCIMTLIEGEVYFEDPKPEPTEPADMVPLPTVVDKTMAKTDYNAYAIVGGTVHPISGPVIPHGTVVMINDKIHAVGSDVKIPPGAGVIDATGQHVYPGLIDAGSKIGLIEIDSLRGTRDYGEIGVFNPHLRAASAFHPSSVHVRIVRTVGITTTLTRPFPPPPAGFSLIPRMAAGGRIFGQSAVVHLNGWTTPEMLMVDTFGLHMSVPSQPVHLPVDAKKKEKLQKQYRKTMKRLESFFTQATHYAKVSSLAAKNPKTMFEIDLPLQAMIPYVRGQKPVVFDAQTYKQIVDSLAFAKKHNLRCVLSGAKESWKLADVLAQRDIPVILGPSFGYPSSKFEPWDSVYHCASVLDRAGVRFCFASESASESVNLGIEVAMAVAHGLPRERAEYALTLGAAKILGMDDRVGSIEVGKQADVIVTTASPLQAASVVTHMFIQGRPIELTSKQTELYTKYEHRPTPKLPDAPLHLRGPHSLTR